MHRLVLPLLLGAVVSPQTFADEPVKSELANVWHRDLNKAAKLARETNRPMFVVFRCER